MQNKIRLIIIAFFLQAILTQISVAQWYKISAYQSYFFNEVFFWDKDNGWITEAVTYGPVYDGVRVLHTTDAGNNWEIDTLPNAFGSVNRDICFVEKDYGFISGDDGVWKTTNGGVTWINITPKNLTYIPQYTSGTAWFKDRNNGVFGWNEYLAGDNIMHFSRTSDAGLTWTETKMSVPNLGYIERLGASAYYNGIYYFTGTGGTLYTSNNDGANFVLTNVGNNGFQEDIYVNQNNLLIASMHYQPDGGKMSRSTDQGLSWVHTDFVYWMWGVTMYSPTHGWSCGDLGKTYKTTDAGKTWITNNCGMDTIDRIDDIYFVDAENGWAVGDGIYKFDDKAKSVFVRPDTLDFGSYLLNQQSPAFYAKITTLSGQTTASRRFISGADAAMFTSTDVLTSPYPIKACDFSSTPIRFKPTSYGTKYAKLEFVVNGISPNPFVVLKGEAEKPTISLPSELELDPAICQGDSNALYFSIMNNGNVPLVVDTVYIENAVGGVFTTQIINKIRYPDTIRARSNGLVLITYKLSQGFSQATADLVVKSNTETQVSTVKLRTKSGNVSYALENLINDTLTLPATPVGKPTSGKFIFKNKGNLVQRLDYFYPIVNYDSIVNFPNINRDTVKVDSSLEINFRGVAQDTGWFFKKYQLEVFPCRRIITIVVRFYSQSALFALPYKSKIDYLGVACGNTESYDTLTYSSEGNIDLVVDSLVIVGQDSAQFEIIYPKNLPDTLPIKKNKTIITKFKPDATNGRKQAKLLVYSNDVLPYRKPWKIDLSGTKGTAGFYMNPKIFDVGDICLRQEQLVESFAFNNGNVDGRLVNVRRLINNQDVRVARFPNNISIKEAEYDSVHFVVKPTKLGPIEETFVLDYQPCDLHDTVRVIGNAIGADIQLSKQIIDYGRIGVKSLTTDSVVIFNKNNFPITLYDVRLVPATPYAMTSSSLPQTIQPNSSATFLFRVYLPDSTASVTTEAKLMFKTPNCDDTLAIPFKALSQIGVLADGGKDISFGQITTCDSLKTETFTLVHRGGNSSNILNIYFKSGNSKFKILNKLNFPIRFNFGDSIKVDFGVANNFIGLQQDSIIVEIDDPQTSRLAYAISGVGINVGLDKFNSDKTPLDSLYFLLNRCDNSGEKIIILRNSGNLDDSVSITSLLPTTFLVQPANVVIKPNQEVGIKIKALLNKPEEYFSSLKIESQPCNLKYNIPLHAIYIAAMSLTDATANPMIVGTKTNLPCVIRNSSNIPQTIDSIVIPKPSRGFLITNNYVGKVINPKDSLVIDIEFTPEVKGIVSNHLQVFFKGECADSLSNLLLGEGLTDDRALLGIQPPPQTIKRWGSVADMVFEFSNLNSSDVSEINVKIKAEPKLLNPLKVVPIVPNVNVSNTSYNKASGEYSFTLSSTTGLKNSSKLFSVQYDVLRGNFVETEILAFIDSSDIKGIYEKRTGNFVLEDYCDAYHRRLKVTGNIALLQNYPNPFNPKTNIEYETAFSGKIRLILYNSLGEVEQVLVDEYQPAGRRIYELDATKLPSGVYTYTLETGLQRLMRRLVVSK